MSTQGGGKQDDAERSRSKKDATSRRGEGDRDEPKRERGEGTLRGRLEGMVPEIVKRTMVSGLGALFMTEETIRAALSDMPKDAVNFLVQQADNTKDQLLALIAKEVRDYLGDTDLNDEFARLLSKLSVEIRTSIRFVPNESRDESEKGKPDIKHEVAVKRRKRRQPS